MMCLCGPKQEPACQDFAALIHVRRGGQLSFEPRRYDEVMKIADLFAAPQSCDSELTGNRGRVANDQARIVDIRRR